MIKKLLLSICLMYTLGATAQTNLNQGLVLHLSFTGNVKDSSGNNRHGTNNGAILTSDRCDNTNSAYSFNGMDGFIEVPSAGLLNDFYSYSIWVYATEIPSNGNYTYPFSIGGSGGGQNIALCNNSMQGWSGGAYNNGSPAASLVALGSQPNLGEWYHVVLVRDTNKLKLYVDGVLNTNEISYGSWNTNNGGLKPNYGSNPRAIIGCRDLNASFFFTGIIDDVRIYNRVITTDEVNALYREKSCFFTSITEFDNPQDFSVYPNPATSQLNIDIVNAGDATEYSIINSVGQTVCNGNITAEAQTITVQLPVLPSGVYTVSLKTNNSIINKRVVIVQ
jgi:hypothetical protein